MCMVINICARWDAPQPQDPFFLSFLPHFFQISFLLFFSLFHSHETNEKEVLYVYLEGESLCNGSFVNGFSFLSVPCLFNQDLADLSDASFSLLEFICYLGTSKHVYYSINYMKY